MNCFSASLQQFCLSVCHTAVQHYHQAVFSRTRSSATFELLMTQRHVTTSEKANCRITTITNTSPANSNSCNYLTRLSIKISSDDIAASAGQFTGQRISNTSQYDCRNNARYRQLVVIEQSYSKLAAQSPPSGTQSRSRFVHILQYCSTLFPKCDVIVTVIDRGFAMPQRYLCVLFVSSSRKTFCVAFSSNFVRHAHNRASQSRTKSHQTERVT